MSNKNRKRGTPQSTGTTPMTTPENTVTDPKQTTDAGAADQPSQDQGAGATEGTTDEASRTNDQGPVEETPAPTEALVVKMFDSVTRDADGAITANIVETAAPSATSMGVLAEPKPALDVGALLREKSDFEQVVDTVIADGNLNMKTLASTLRDYNTVMGANASITEATINMQQGALWRVIRMVLNSGEDFEAGMSLIIAFVRNGREGAFADTNLFRGFEHTRMIAMQAKAFQTTLVLLTTTADVKNRTQVRKTVDLGRVMASEVFSPEARTRVLGFFA